MRPILKRNPVRSREFLHRPFAVEAPEVGILLSAEWRVGLVIYRNIV